ncbi:uncharacterized protein F4822DRAFT_194273 [Hypoxylon trugodes]|uniref:uncharacterized protein n=1 Tax=Hypoxylon trugodes TaxID=326681 RepID=UPI00219202BA|nr:uncharacterized protein F4822DRAFT_194273 [Hypoxylon trugodes]KAI1389249.1 hypothetical protein F4822DRAFT_194273 [Hypoxylon trugodes]
MKTSIAFIVTLASASHVQAHVAAWVKGMFCLNGTEPGVDDANTNTAVLPLYQLPKSEWWMQHDRSCDQFPPDEGDFLELPAGKSFTVELAHNRAQTTLSFKGQFTSEWPDGGQHPEDWHSPSPDTCLDANPDQAGGAMHTHNESTAAGTAFAISYNSDISKVTMENLAVFTVLQHTPWKRLATYDVPADLPPCPEGGCYCAWLWVPDGCGQPNMYMQNFRCRVTGSTSTKTVAAAKSAVFCGDGKTPCIEGAKQMIAWNQIDGNNFEMPAGISPGYNEKMGWKAGAQNDIFL